MLKLSRQLFADAADRDAFVEALLHPQPFHPTILWCQDVAERLFVTETPLDWQPPFVDRLTIAEKPGQHPLHASGFFYCLDFSSVFAAAPLLMLPSPVKVAFDMCAAPGGKSIFAWKTLHPDRLLCNEVIGKRIGALISNLKRCQIKPAIVLNLDSKVVAEQCPKTADVVIVDAPCSGQSLLAKGGKAPGCFHPVSVNKNANRQKRIVANSAQLVAPQGFLLYMTCTYAPEENEQVITWLLTHFPQFQPIEVPHLADYRSQLSDSPCYRMFPQSRLGAGAFTALLQNTETAGRATLPAALLEHPRFQMI